MEVPAPPAKRCFEAAGHKNLVRLVLVAEACSVTTIDSRVLNHFIGMYVRGLPALIAPLLDAI